VERLDIPVSLVRMEHDLERLDRAAVTPVEHVLQTTLGVDDTRAIVTALRRHLIDMVGPEINDVCRAARNRHSAVHEIAKLAEVILVVGAKNSSNLNCRCETGAEAGAPSHLVAGGSELGAARVWRGGRIGITAGASAPEELADGVVVAPRPLGSVEGSSLSGCEEKVEFRLSAEMLPARSVPKPA